MKSLKKISIALVLSFLMIFSMVACGSKNDSKEAEAVLTEALDCFSEWDLVGFGEYFVDGSSFKECGIRGTDDFVDLILAQMGFDEIFDVVGKENETLLVSAYNSLVSDVFDMIEYEVVEVVEAGKDKCVFVVEFTVPDFATMDLSDALNYDAGYELGQKLVEEGIITPDMTSDEIMDVTINALVNYMYEVFEEEIDDIEVITETARITLVKIDGKWLIDEELNFDVMDMIN